MNPDEARGQNPEWKSFWIWSAEITCQIPVLIALLLFIAFMSDPNRIPGEPGISLRDLSFLLYATFFSMLFSGYLITTAMAGVFFRSKLARLYPTIAAGLFIAHTQFFTILMDGWKWNRPDPTFMVFQASGACIVFACTFVGGRVLRKWTADKTSLIAQ
jgi:hypothetical protein